jgi:hypothetical protein
MSTSGGAGSGTAGQAPGTAAVSTMPAAATDGSASATGAAAASVTATLAAVAAKFGYCEGFDVTIGAATAAALSACTVTGLQGGTLTYQVQQETGAGATLSIRFPRPQRTSAVNTAVVVNVPATANGGAPSVTVFGWTL